LRGPSIEAASRISSSALPIASEAEKRSDLRTLEATGADPRWAMIVLLRHAAELEATERTPAKSLALVA
jgi:hypothetical protein